MRCKFNSHKIFVFVLTFMFGLSALKAENAAPQAEEKGSFVATGFLDAYAGHDFNDPYTETRPYTTQALYDDETRVNLALLDMKLSSDSLRSRVALQAGDSVKSNYAAEEDLFWRYVQEGSVGVKLTDDLWLDSGVYLAHVGFESFNSKDNWNYTRSLVAEYSPYYETGGKLTYQASDSLTIQGHLVHGWQNISSSAEPMYGVQVNYNPTPATQFVYANLLGEQGGGFRNFHDFIIRHNLTDDFSAAFQFDFGSQGRENNDTANWYGFAFLTQYKINDKLALGTRVEKYSDPDAVLVSTTTGEDFNVTGLSANIDYEIQKGLLWRTEYRVLLGSDDIFPKSNVGENSSNDSLIVTSLSYAFDIGGFKW